MKLENTLVSIGPSGYNGPVVIGGPELVVIAGPCAVETRDQAFAAAEAVKLAGGHLFRGGAFKPRTSPYAFQGLGIEGLKILADIRSATGLGIVTEAVDEASLDAVCAIRGLAASRSARATCKTSRYFVARDVSKLPVLLKRWHVRDARRKIPDGGRVHSLGEATTT